MANNGYKISVYLDDNPNSITYMETYEERTEDTEKCPISEDDLVLVSNECEISITGYTGYRILIYYNRTTKEYLEVREEDPECIESSTDEIWVDSGSPYCETTEQGVNTGYMLQLQVQTNPNISTYGDTRVQRWKDPQCGSNSCPIWEEVSRQCHVEVFNCAATFDGTADVVQIDANPLSPTYNQTRQVNIESTATCENCSETTFEWVLVGDLCGDDTLLCNNGIQEVSTNSYTVRRKYKTVGSNVIPMDEYQVVLKTEDDEDCGYIRPQYRWDVVAGEYLCDYQTYTKYEKKIKMVSYDSGATWSVKQPVEEERGEVLAYDSYDCGKPLYRWIETNDYICEDNGDDWKLKVTNDIGETVFTAPCNESAILRQEEISNLSSSGHFDFGNCVNDINCRITYDAQSIRFGEYVEYIGDGSNSLFPSGALYSENCFDDNLRVIRNHAFYGSNFTDGIVHLGTKIESIGNDAFYLNSNHCYRQLTTLIIDTFTPPTIGSEVFYHYNGATYSWKTNCRDSILDCIFVPRQQVEAYRTAWSQYADYIFSQAEEDIFYRATYTGGVQGWAFSPEGNNNVLSKNIVRASYKGMDINDVTSVYLSDYITTIGEEAFTYDYTVSSGITSLTLPKNLEVISTRGFGGYANVLGLVGLRTVDMSRCERLRVIGENAFYGCISLSGITIPDTVTEIGDGAFRRCSSATYVNISDNSSLTSIGEGSFYGCTSLASVTFGNNITTIGEDAFGFCSGLTSVTLPDSVSSIGKYAFRFCKRMTSCTIGSGLTSIGSYAFSDCSGLTSLTISSVIPPTINENTFQNIRNDLVIYVPCCSVELYKDTNIWSSLASRIRGIAPCSGQYRTVDSTPYCVGYDKYYDKIYQYSDGAVWQTVTSVPILIAEKSIDCGYVGKMKGYYSDGTISNVVCDGSTSLNQGESKPTGYDYTLMTSAEIGECVQSIGTYTFQNFPLTSITMSAVTSIDYQAFKNSGLKSIDLSTVTSLGREAFASCYKLTDVIIGCNVSQYCFSGCRSLTSVTFGNHATSIGYGSFEYCSGMTSINIPDSISSIDDYAFSDCSGLTTCSIGTGIRSIGFLAFRRCVNLNTLIVNAVSPPSIKSDTFKNTNIQYILVPEGSVNAYKSATNWSSYSSKIMAIP